MNLTNNFRIAYDECCVVLEFFETRTKLSGNKKGEFYEYVDRFYYPNIKMALKAFIQKDSLGTDDVRQVLKRMDELEILIDKLNL